MLLAYTVMMSFKGSHWYLLWETVNEKGKIKNTFITIFITFLNFYFVCAMVCLRNRKHLVGFSSHHHGVLGIESRLPGLTASTC